MHSLPLLIALLSIPDPFADLSRFPPNDYANHQRCVALIQYKYWEKQAQPCGEMAGIFVNTGLFFSPLILHSPEREATIANYRMAKYRLACWESLWHATTPGTESMDEKLEGLRRLRILLPEHDWYAGQMP